MKRPVLGRPGAGRSFFVRALNEHEMGKEAGRQGKGKA